MNRYWKSPESPVAKFRGGRFLTTYNQDYTKAENFKPTPFIPEKSEFANPLAIGHKQYLTLKEDDSLDEEYQFGENYLNEVKAGHGLKCKKKHSEHDINFNVLRAQEIFKGKSTYQTHYCDLESDKAYFEDLKKTSVHLPSESNVPLTTLKNAFRDPKSVRGKDIERIPIIKPINNLKRDEHLESVLNIHTGSTEYEDRYSKLGEFIITRRMHGEIIHDECTEDEKIKFSVL